MNDFQWMCLVGRWGRARTPSDGLPSEEQLRLPGARATLRLGPLRCQAQDLAGGVHGGRLPGAARAARGHLAERLAAERDAAKERPVVGDAVAGRDEDVLVRAGDGEDLRHAVLDRQVDRAGLVPLRLVQLEECDAAVLAGNHGAEGRVLGGLHRAGRRHGAGGEERQPGRRDGHADGLARGRVRARGEGAGVGHDREAGAAPGHAARHAELREAVEDDLRRDAGDLAHRGLRRHHGAGAAGREDGAGVVRAAGEELRLERRRPLHRRGNDGADRGALLQAAVAAGALEVVGTLRFVDEIALLLGHAVRDAPGRPGVLADAGGADPRLGALRLGPPHVGLGGEAEDVGGPDLLLALGAPAVLPGPVAPHRRDVRVVLGGDGAGLPAVPLADAGPGRLAGVRHEHALAHRALDGAAGELDGPAGHRQEEQCADVVPRGHVHVLQRVLLDGVPLAVLLLLGQLRLRLRRGDEVGAVLERVRQPGGHLAGGAVVEEAAAGLAGLVRRAGAGRPGDDVKADGPEELHDHDPDAEAARDVNDGLRGRVRVGQGERDGRDEGARRLDGEAASVLGQHVEAEHRPDGGGEAGSAHVRAPDHAQLGDVVEGDPIREGLDEVHHGDQEADAAVGLAAPVLLLGRADQLEVLERLHGALAAVAAGRRLRVLLAGLHLLVDPRRVARCEAGQAALELREGALLLLALLALLGILLVLLLGALGALVLLLVRGVGAVRHHEGQAEHVVDVLLLPGREDLARGVELPLGGHRDADLARPELDGHDLRAERGVEDEPRGERREAEADAEALEVDARDEDRRSGELQARAALDEDSDAHGLHEAQQGAVGAELHHGDRGEVGDVLAEHVDLRHGHLPARGVARPAQTLVILVVGAVVAPAKHAGALDGRSVHHR
mmetsp:Transcript_29157/g.86562  ORF Transcript_29157/g.86562 Transcript_29157/m.86562 type:complete len:899 (-) Transcript_29157:108-2804(-)